MAPSRGLFSPVTGGTLTQNEWKHHPSGNSSVLLWRQLAGRTISPGAGFQTTVDTIDWLDLQAWSYAQFWLDLNANGGLATNITTVRVNAFQGQYGGTLGVGSQDFDPANQQIWASLSPPGAGHNVTFFTPTFITAFGDGLIEKGGVPNCPKLLFLALQVDLTADGSPGTLCNFAAGLNLWR